MNILTDVIVVVLKSLIWIGDQVLNALTIAKSVEKVSLPKLKRIKPSRRTKKNLLKARVELALFLRNLSDFPKNILQKIRNPNKRVRIKAKKRKGKLVTVFPPPPTFFLKLKYFLFGALFSIVFISIPVLLVVFVTSLPDPRQLAMRDIAQTTKIYDRNGKLLYQIYANQNRTLVPLKSVPKDLINATIAIEDKDFYQNPGFEIQAIIRAAIANLSGQPLQGGSTITQQLIKSTLLTPERTVTRKVKEIILAFWAERLYSKNEILEMYFNQIPYGGTAWGVEAAAQTYFGKEVKDLTLSESSFLAGMPKAPSIYSPYSNQDNLWVKRQKEVLAKMAEQKFITPEQKLDAESQTLTFLPHQTPIYAPHYVFYIKDLLIKKYGIALVEKGGLNVVTSLDLDLQERVQEQVRTEVDRSIGFNLTNGAALVTNPKNGDILAMVGSKNFDEEGYGNVNITTSLRQPGSSIKVITYSAALKDGFTAATPIVDSPTTFRDGSSQPYTPVNYDGRFHGVMTLRTALANSINIPAVKTLQRVGVGTMIDLAKKMGVTTWNSPERYGLSLTLGAAEVKMVDMATVYGTLANGGKRVDLAPLVKVSDSRGQVLFEKKNPPAYPVLDEGVAFIMSSILSDNSARSAAFGLNSPLNIPGVSVKTGTTDRIKDNWTIGYTKDYVVSVWVGNNNGEPMSGIASGITGAAPIWRNIMANLVVNKPAERVRLPINIVEKFCLGRKEYFIKGTENQIRCTSPTPTPPVISAN